MEPVKGGPAVGSAEDTGTAAGHHATLSARERAELEAFRAELEALRAEVAAA